MEMPVVSTRHNGIPEHVIDGETGFLVNEFDYVTMAERMVELARDEVKRTKMGAAGRANVRTLCDAKQRMEFIRNLF